MSDKMDDAVKTLSGIVDLPDGVVSLSKVKSPEGAKRFGQPIGDKVSKGKAEDKNKTLSELTDDELDAAIKAAKSADEGEKPEHSLKALQSEKSSRFVKKYR